MSEETAIKIEHIYKKYRLGQIGTTTLFEELERWRNGLRNKKTNVDAEKSRKLAKEEFWALKDIDLVIHKGDVVGLIGANGAGKSTLLKLLCRITAPTSGRIIINGRVTSMLEVGTGFNPEMTGRENIYLNGAILGLSMQQIDAKMDEIIEFSEIGEFIDTPVKRYSSGMYVKLAFSVASHLESEIVVMDEVLAVGDAMFQKKCLERMLSLVQDGEHTIVFVSHNAASVKKLCNRGVVLRNGSVVFDGGVEEAIDYYNTDNGVGSQFGDRDLIDAPRGSWVICPDCIEKIEGFPNSKGVYSRNDKIELAMTWSVKSEADSVYTACTITDSEGNPIGRFRSKSFGPVNEGIKYKTVMRPEFNRLNAGEYKLLLELRCDNEYSSSMLDGLEAYSFRITDSSDAEKCEWSTQYWGKVEFFADSYTENVF